MLPFLAQHLLEGLWGPFRLLESRLVLSFLGCISCAFFTWILLPRFWDRMPHDRGKAFVKGSEAARGKPTGAGLLMTGVFLVCAFFVMPFYGEYALIGCALFAIMLTGYLDDRSSTDWGQLKKGAFDLLISLFAAWVIAKWQGTTIWLPFIKGALPGGAILLPTWAFVLGGAALLWIMINVVNCSDGVDAVAGSLALYGLFAMGALLYACLGHEVVAKYLILPHVENGASWGIVLFTACGGLAAYLWYNAPPSQVLMGDAGSRFYGLLLGIAVLVAGNPFLFLVAAPILFVNGGAGLVKLLLLRGLKKCGLDTRPPLSSVDNPINPKNFATDEEAERQHPVVKLLHRYRFPIHDHCRKNMGWSNPQVLVRFMLLQTLLMPLFAIIMIKLR